MFLDNDTIFKIERLGIDKREKTPVLVLHCKFDFEPNEFRKIMFDTMLTTEGVSFKNEQGYVVFCEATSWQYDIPLVDWTPDWASAVDMAKVIVSISVRVRRIEVEKESMFITWETVEAKRG